MDDTVNVIEVQLQKPHAERVLATRLPPADAEAFIKIAIARRGVETHFYTTRPAGSL